MKRNGEEAVKQTHKRAGKERSKYSDDDNNECRGFADRTAHKLKSDTAAGGSEAHDSGNSEVEVTGFFRQYLTCRAVKEGHSE
jgi:hypothetical protein